MLAKSSTSAAVVRTAASYLHNQHTQAKIIRNGVAVKAFTVPFARAFKASEDVRHLNVVVVSCVNELSLLCGFLGRFFLAALFRGLLLSCHIGRSPS